MPSLPSLSNFIRRFSYYLPSLNSSEERKKFNRKLSQERRMARDNRSGLLGWVHESEWRNLEMEYLKIVADIGEVSSKITERTKFLGLEDEA